MIFELILQSFRSCNLVSWFRSMPKLTLGEQIRLFNRDPAHVFLPLNFNRRAEVQVNEQSQQGSCILLRKCSVPHNVELCIKITRLLVCSTYPFRFRYIRSNKRCFELFRIVQMGYAPSWITHIFILPKTYAIGRQNPSVFSVLRHITSDERWGMRQNTCVPSL